MVLGLWVRVGVRKWIKNRAIVRVGRMVQVMVKSKGQDGVWVSVRVYGYE